MPQGEGWSEARPPATPRERDVGSAPGQDTEVGSPVSRLGGPAPQTATTTSVAHHQQSWEDLVLTSTLPRPNQLAGPLQIYRKVVPLSPFPLPLLSLQEPGPATEEAGELFPRQGEFDSNPGVYIMNHPKQEIFE